MAQRHFLNRKKICLYLAVFIIFFRGALALGYVMPEDQILDFMCSNFKAIRKVSIIHSTLQTTGINERVFTEQIWIESPDMYAVKALDRMGNRDQIPPDLIYRQLFVMNSREKLERLLLSIGIDLSQTSLTRLDGVIAMRIGGKDANSPKLIIEKERFLPLLISYRLPGEEDLVTVIFKDYQRKEVGWHPFEIIYKKGEGLTEKYTVQSLQENNTKEETLVMTRFNEYPLPAKPEPENLTPEQAPDESATGTEHLQDVLKTYEEQYRQP
jgi:hypothetical protein